MLPDLGAVAIAHGADVCYNNKTLKESACKNHKKFCKMLLAFIQEEKLLVSSVVSARSVGFLIALGSRTLVETKKSLR